MKIDDGTGTGKAARVDSSNRLAARAVSQAEADNSTTLGLSYNINTGYVAFTTDGTLLYLFNDEDEDIFIQNIIIANDGSGTHSSLPYITIVRNPTNGDLISDATDVDMNQNRNFASSKSLASTTLVYKGKVSGTLTGGDDFAYVQIRESGRDSIPINISLPKGSSIAITLTANLSSGTANIYAALAIHAKE